MLSDFQQALADLTASPEMCVRVRQDPTLLQRHYELTQREWLRLSAIVNHSGMKCACIVYRANRLAPLALNLPALCKALGKELRAVASEYWAAFPEANVHFFVEADRFCRFLKHMIEQGRVFSHRVYAALQTESESVAAALHESHTEGHDR